VTPSWPSGQATTRGCSIIWTGDRQDGDILLVVHLLWELVHDVLAQPELLVPEVPVCRDDICITCSDEGRIVEVQSVIDGHTALARAMGQEERVDISVVSDVMAGDLLLVHAGLALTVVTATRSTSQGGHFAIR
jgi:hydrogenase maturation factor